eukprot:c13211_g1_i1.p1 GENE.c13211_g1_i1~~c13211_g1_i1.p1  ORF type:complete len:151 (-),score=3.99 c13211_g1_i1:179-631(-)
MIFSIPNSMARSWYRNAILILNLWLYRKRIYLICPSLKEKYLRSSVRVRYNNCTGAPNSVHNLTIIPEELEYCNPTIDFFPTNISLTPQNISKQPARCPHPVKHKKYWQPLITSLGRNLVGWAPFREYCWPLRCFEGSVEPCKCGDEVEL